MDGDGRFLTERTVFIIKHSQHRIRPDITSTEAVGGTVFFDVAVVNPVALSHANEKSIESSANPKKALITLTKPFLSANYSLSFPGIYRRQFL